MISRSTLRWMAVLGLAGVAAACAVGRPGLGDDPSTRTQAKAVTWSDGKEAIQITCELPGSCQTRAVAICKSSNYTVLSMNNMPSRGDMTEMRGAGTVVVRCP